MHRSAAELDQAIAVARRLIQVDDACLRRRVGIDGEPGPADQPLVSAGSVERVAVGKSCPFVDVDSDSVAHPMLLNRGRTVCPGTDGFERGADPKHAVVVVAPADDLQARRQPRLRDSGGRRERRALMQKIERVGHVEPAESAPARPRDSSPDRGCRSAVAAVRMWASRGRRTRRRSASSPPTFACDRSQSS